MLKPSKNYKAAKKRADEYFQKFIRLRDKGKPCITCGRYINLQCGHFRPRAHMCTRYEERNSHGQCPECNGKFEGRYKEHEIAIDKMYGEGASHDLYLKSKMKCQKDKYTLDEIARYYAAKIKELEASR